MDEAKALAVWQVSGENYEAMCTEASRDAHEFMGEVPHSAYTVHVFNCQPLRKWQDGAEVGKAITDGHIDMWEGLAMIRWSPL